MISKNKAPKELLQQKQEENEKYARYWHAVSDSAIEIDLAGIIVDTSHLLPELDVSEVIGTSVFNFLSKDQGNVLRDKLKKVRSDREAAYFELSLFDNGSQSWWSTRIFPLLSKNTVKGFLILGQDISERKNLDEAVNESEEKYRSIFSAANEGIIITDAATLKVIDVNNAALKIYGYSRTEFMELRHTDFSLNPESKAKIIRSVRKNVFSDISYNYLRKKDGTVFPADLSVTKFEFGGKEAYCTVCKDITEKVKAQKEVLKVDKLDSLGMLAGGIAHDFNNFLLSFELNLSLLKKHINRDNPNVAQITGRLEKSLERSAQLTKQLVTFSKGGAPVKSATEIKELIKQTANFVLSGSPLHISYDFDKKPITCDCDKGQISQVITNLLHNAREASKKRGTLNISAHNMILDSDNDFHLNSGDYVLITVEDNGEGIKEKNISNIFDPFFTTRDSKNGLGLSTCHSIVVKHGGSISVESKRKKGTKFSIYLPSSPVKEERHGNELPVHTEQNARILCMDDDESLRIAMEELLRTAGHDVYVVSDGAKAKTEYKESMKADKPYDLVILDLNVMEGMGGAETIKELMLLNPEIKAVVSSGYSNEPVMAKYKDYGFKAVLNKPFNYDELIRVVSEVLLRRKK